MKKIQYIVILLLFSSPSWSQGLTDALRLSDYRINGTARATAMGNAFGALGGDFTSASINPAGIGLYRSNEFVFTTRFGENQSDATYLGRTTNESKFNLSVPNIGYIATFNSQQGNPSSLVSVNIGIGYNRMNDFNTKKLVIGNNATSSMLDLFSQNADNLAPDELSPFYEQLAAYDQETDFGTDLIYNNEEGAPAGVYRHDMQLYPYTDDYENYEHGQRKSFSQKGSIDEYVFSIAANFNHKVYLGATFGIHDVYLQERTSLYEYDSNGNIPVFNNYSFDTFLKTTGTGFNAKFGIIVKPIDQLRFGVALHTPTFYDLADYYYNDMYSSFDDGDNLEAFSPDDEYEYQLQTPMKAIFSAAYIIGKQGLISVDYEWVDYSKVKLSDGEDGYDFFSQNEDIDESLESVGNLHVGGEFRLSEYFSLRGGFEYFPSPYKKAAYGIEQPNGNADTYTYSGGLGWKAGDFYLDLAYKHINAENYLNLYDVPETANPQNYTSPTTKFKNQSDFVTLTLGFRF